MEQQQRCEAEAMRRQKGRMQKNQAQLGVGVCVKLGHTCPQNYAGSKGCARESSPKRRPLYAEAWRQEGEDK